MEKRRDEVAREWQAAKGARQRNFLISSTSKYSAKEKEKKEGKGGDFRPGRSRPRGHRRLLAADSPSSRPFLLPKRGGGGRKKKGAYHGQPSADFVRTRARPLACE